MNPRTYTRGESRYLIDGDYPDYRLSVGCDCILGPHWHLLSTHWSVLEAELAIRLLPW